MENTTRSLPRCLARNVEGLLVACADAKAELRAGRERGDSLVTASRGYSFSTLSGSGVKGYRLGASMVDRAGKITARDQMDGECFASLEDADAYGLRAGLHFWYSAWKLARVAMRPAAASAAL